MRRGETKTFFFDEIVAKLERNESEIKKQPSRNNLNLRTDIGIPRTIETSFHTAQTRCKITSQLSQQTF